MCLNISLVTQDLSADHPRWNDASMHGDKLIGKLLALPCITHRIDDTTSVWRPEDFSQWRALVNSWPQDRGNSDRFPHMLNILEEDQDYWIYLST
jgi:hypothetical protein